MKQVRFQLAEGVHSDLPSAEQYKTAVLSAGFVLPLTEDNTHAALLPQVLHRGTARSSRSECARAILDIVLYGARIYPYVRKTGDAVVIGTIADVIDEAYVPQGEALTARLASLLYRIWHAPYLQNNLLSADYIAAEGAFLADKIAAQKNDTQTYSMRRMQECMCKGEPYGQNEYGSAQTARTVSPAALSQFWQDTISAAPIELFYCGSMEPEMMPPHALRLSPQGKAPIRSPESFPIPRRIPRTRWWKRWQSHRASCRSVSYRTDRTRCSISGTHAFFHGIWRIYRFPPVSSCARKAEPVLLCKLRTRQAQGHYGGFSSGIENRSFDAAKDEILHQLADLQAGSLTEDELEAARRTLLNQLRTMQDNPASLERFFQGQAVGGLTYDLDTLMARVAGLTREDVLPPRRVSHSDTVYFLKGVAVLPETLNGCAKPCRPQRFQTVCAYLLYSQARIFQDLCHAGNRFRFGRFQLYHGGRHAYRYACGCCTFPGT